MADRHTVHSIVLNGSTPLALGALVSGAHTNNYTMTQPDSGGPFTEVKYVQQLEAKIDAVTESLTTVLENLPLTSALCVSGAEAFTSIDLFGRNLDSCGAESTAAGNAHRRTRGALSKLFVKQISVSANQTAQVTLMGYLLSSDGVVIPYTTVHNVALPATAGLITTEQSKLHGVQVAGVVLNSNHLTQATLDTGMEPTLEFGVGQYAQEVTLTKTAPTWTFETEQTTLLDPAVFPTEGRQATHLNSAVEYQRRDPGTGGFFSPAATEHSRITFAGHARVDSPFSGSGSQKATARLVVECTGESGAPPLTANTGAALTL